MSGFVSW